VQFDPSAILPLIKLNPQAPFIPELLKLPEGLMTSPYYPSQFLDKWHFY